MKNNSPFIYYVVQVATITSINCHINFVVKFVITFNVLYIYIYIERERERLLFLQINR